MDAANEEGVDRTEVKGLHLRYGMEDRQNQAGRSHSAEGAPRSGPGRCSDGPEGAQTRRETQERELGSFDPQEPTDNALA